MSPRVILRWAACLLAVFLVVLLQQANAAQAVWGAAQARPRSVSPALPSNPGNAPKPELLNLDSDPTLHYPVAVDEGGSVSSGWFDVSRNHVLYSVVVSSRGGRSAGRKEFAPEGVVYLVPPVAKSSEEGFEASSNQITVVQFEKGALLLVVSKRKVLVTYLPQNQWYQAQNQRSFFALAGQYLAGTTSIQEALRSFETVLAAVKPPPAVDVSLRAEPASVEKGRPVKLIWSSANATNLNLEPGVGKLAASGEMSVVPQDSTSYTLTAAGPGGTKIASASITVTAPVSVPTLVLTEPSVADGQSVEVASTPLVIHGVVMDASGMPVVTVNGSSVTMRPTSAQAAQFASDPLALRPGENKFEVTAVNSAQGRSEVTFIARFTSAAPKVQPLEPGNSQGLDKAEILNLLRGDVPSARVAELVKERGIKFVPTAADLADIRTAGGGDDLIDTINRASPRT